MMASKCKRYCSVPQCSTYKSPDVSIHQFPTERILCNKWRNALKIGKPITRGMSVCSKHFVETDFTISTPHTKIRRLKKGVIPSQNIPVSSHQKIKKNLRSHRMWLNNLESNSNYGQDGEQEDDENTVTSADVQMNQESISEFNKPQSSSYGKEKEPLIHEIFMVDKATQTDYTGFHFDEVLGSDKKLCAFTGVDNDIITASEKCIKNVMKYNGEQATENLHMKIILVLIKLKLNISFTCLSIMFSISLTTCCRYFESIIELLALALKPALYWPSKDEINANMPRCFEKYKSTRVVLDCTEINVQKCKCLQCRIKTYSHYKGTHTFKFLIGITPSGVISHVSNAYGGKASDKAIFLNEKIIEKCYPHDSIMVDKGFMIEKECEENYLKMIRPPFLKKQKQFSKQDAELTADIARARVHVERSIQRIKTFAILNNKIPWYTIPHVDNIVTVICALVNLSPPLLADDKFAGKCYSEEYDVEA